MNKQEIEFYPIDNITIPSIYCRTFVTPKEICEEQKKRVFHDIDNYLYNKGREFANYLIQNNFIDENNPFSYDVGMIDVPEDWEEVAYKHTNIIPAHKKPGITNEYLNLKKPIYIDALFYTNDLKLAADNYYKQNKKESITFGTSYKAINKNPRQIVITYKIHHDFIYGIRAEILKSNLKRLYTDLKRDFRRASVYTEENLSSFERNRTRKYKPNARTTTTTTIYRRPTRSAKQTPRSPNQTPRSANQTPIFIRETPKKSLKVPGFL